MDDMPPLSVCAFRTKLNYQRLRNALLAGLVRGERRGARWFVSPGDARQFESREPVNAAG